MVLGKKHKVHQSRDWLYREYAVKRRKPEEIAKTAGVSLQTIYRKLTAFGLIKGKGKVY